MISSSLGFVVALLSQLVRCIEMHPTLLRMARPLSVTLNWFQRSRMGKTASGSFKARCFILVTLNGGWLVPLWVTLNLFQGLLRRGVSFLVTLNWFQGL